ncbi:hypothetical protein [Neptunomonas sp.]|uniref:hypothetical protein n=1 Tax=Neptunomonas sp. TaxID=1971898 RepID=UPI0035684D92
MSKVRIFFIAICIILGISIFILKALSGFWLSAFSGLIAGFVVSGIIVFWEDGDSKTFIVKVFGGVSLILGVMGVFAESDAFNTSLTKAHVDAVSQLAKANNSCESKTNEVQNIINYAILVCALQSNRNLQSAIIDIEKQLKLSPELGLIDSALSLTKKENISKCASAFRTSYKYCKSSFGSMNKESKELLLE